MWSKVDCPSPPTDCRSSEDSYIGCSHIDLSTLAFGLPQISGWYNITDFAGQIQGQIKVNTCTCIHTEHNLQTAFEVEMVLESLNVHMHI